MISIQDKLAETIRDVKGFPKEGIIFKDITPILQDFELCTEISNAIAHRLQLPIHVLLPWERS